MRTEHLSPVNGATEIIANIQDIYNRLRIPPNLREHMATVASIVNLICNHWGGPKIDKNAAIAAALLHDVGNLVRFDLDSKQAQENFGKQLEYYKKVQKELREKYEAIDDHKVTELMLIELNVDRHILKVVSNFDTLLLERSKRELEAKIGDYADARVSPEGVTSVKSRFEDLIRRRGKDAEAARKWRDIESACLAIENEILGYTDLKPKDISNDSIRPYLKNWRS